MISVHRSEFSFTSSRCASVVPQTFTFPGGEIGVKFDPENHKFNNADIFPTKILARLTSSEEIMKLVMIKNALEHLEPKSDMGIELIMPYVPYGRQDRVCVPGEAFSLQAFARLINSLKFSKVTVLDPHSDVTGALFDNIEIITQLEIIRHFDAFDAVAKIGTFVSPDAGANKKTAELAKYYGHSEFIRADKLRDLNTGKIIETKVYAGDLSGRTVIIADDLIDGGKTFIELAKVLKKKGAGKVVLYATHGIFSAGISTLFDGGIDEIYTTNSYKPGYDSKVITLDIDELVKLK